jgi:hypothetical protein
MVDEYLYSHNATFYFLILHLSWNFYSNVWCLRSILKYSRFRLPQDTSRNWFAIQGPVVINLISWNVVFIWETGYWTRAMQWFTLFDLLKVYIPIPRSCRNIFCLCRDDNKRWIFIKWKCIKISRSTKMSKIFFINVWRKRVFDIYFRS